MEINYEFITRVLLCLLVAVVIFMVGVGIYCLLHIAPMAIVETDIPAQCIGRGC